MAGRGLPNKLGFFTFTHKKKIKCVGNLPDDDGFGGGDGNGHGDSNGSSFNNGGSLTRASPTDKNRVKN